MRKSALFFALFVVFVHAIDNDGTLVVTTIESAPFVIKNRTNGELTGYCIDLMNELMRQTGRKMRVQLVSDGSFGTLVQKPNKYNGMIGELLDKRADLAIAPLTITENRMKVVDFTQPFMTSGLSVMLKKPPRPRLTAFGVASGTIYAVFTVEVWQYLVGAYFITALVLFIVVRLSPVDNDCDRAKGIIDCFHYITGSMFCQHHGIKLRSLSARVIATAWWLFSLLVMITFIIEWLRQCVHMTQEYGIVKSMVELAHRPDITVGIVNGGSSMQWMQMTREDNIERIWNRMESNPHLSFVKTYNDGIMRVRQSVGDYAFIIEATANDYVNAMLPCDTYRMPEEPWSSVNYGIAMRRGADFKLHIDMALEHLRETNFLLNLKLKWWNDMGQCQQLRINSIETSTTGNFLEMPKNWFIHSIQAMLLVLGTALFLALLVALCEFLLCGCVASNRQNRSLTKIYARQWRRTCCGTQRRDYSPDADGYQRTRVVLENGGTAQRPPKHHNEDEERQPMVFGC